MSQIRTTGPIVHLEVSDSRNTSVSTLADQARHAYEHKHTKDCLDLTRAILLIDPDNADAHWMRSSIQSEMQQDLEQSRAFLRQVQSRENPGREPESGDLASSMESNSGLNDFEPQTPDTSPSPAAASGSNQGSGTRWLVYASILSFVIVLVGSIGGLWRSITRPDPVEARGALALPDGVPRANEVPAVPPDPFLITHTAEVPTAATVPPSVSAHENNTLVSSGTAGLAAAAPRPAVPPAVANGPVDAVNSSAAAGTLAVSSPTSVDIYKDEVYLGSAPVSLELPAGTHTLEYRHANLRKNVTHIVNSYETTRATITFDVIVQINSRPWANVFLDGVERKALGQTPLSGVRVPIGSVLILENPQFQPKRYRVTGSERIQIVFP